MWGRCEVDVRSMWGQCEVDVWSVRSAYSFSRNQRVHWFLCHLNASTPANMNCQYCRKIFTSDYNLGRHEDEYCPDRDNDGKECSSPKKSRDADEASMSSNKSMGAHASHDDDDEDTEDESSSGNSSDEENDPWNTLINDAVSKVWDQYKEILQELLMEGHDESKAKEDAFAQILPAFRKELGDIHMDNLTWMTVIWKFSNASVKLLGK